MSDPALPTLHQGDLDEATCERYALDLATWATISEVLVKGGAADHCEATPWTLDAAFAALRDRRIRGLQVRYRYDGEDWCDTLLRLPGGLRLVRMAGTPGT